MIKRVIRLIRRLEDFMGKWWMPRDIEAMKDVAWLR